MVSRLLRTIWMVALAWMVLTGLADILRDGHSSLALVAVVLPISIVILVRASSSFRRMAHVADVKDEQSAAIFCQMSKTDRDHIASLAVSGNTIEAIKALRKLVKVDLRTAKNIVDRLAMLSDD